MHETTKPRLRSERIELCNLLAHKNGVEFICEKSIDLYLMLTQNQIQIPSYLTCLLLFYIAVSITSFEAFLFRCIIVLTRGFSTGFRIIHLKTASAFTGSLSECGLHTN